MDIREMGLAAKSAAVCLSALSTDVKNAALQAIAVGLRTHANELFEANRFQYFNKNPENTKNSRIISESLETGCGGGI